MINMPPRLILASSSEIRATLLANAGVDFDVVVSPIDEDTIKDALVADGASPRDIADALAEGKARKVSQKHPEALVIGCDQTLSFKGRLVSKSSTAEQAVSLLKEMRGERHKLLSAAVIYEGGEPKWRAVGEVRLEMRQLTDGFITEYVARNWDSIRWAVGSYKLEEEGVRLFLKIEGDYFNVLGLPLLEVLAYLVDREVLAS